MYLLQTKPSLALHTYRTVDNKTISLLDRMLYPAPVAALIWGFSSALLKQNLSNIMRMLGFMQRTPPMTVPINAVIQKMVERLQQSATKNLDTADGPNPPVTGQITGDAPAVPSADEVDSLPPSSRSRPRPDKLPSSSSMADVDGHVSTACNIIPHAIIMSSTKRPYRSSGASSARPESDRPPSGRLASASSSRALWSLRQRRPSSSSM